MKKLINYKENLIEVYSEFFYNKYFLSRFFEEKYINIFGKKEIENMQNIYDYLVLDNKIQNMFYYDSEFDNIHLLELISQEDADKEFKDFENQILNLKLKLKSNKTNLDKLKEYKDNSLYLKIKKIIEKISPYINSSKISEQFWKEFLDIMSSQDFYLLDDLIKRTENLRLKDPNYSNEELKLEIENISRLNKNLFKYYPFNLGHILECDKNLIQKQNEIEKELSKSREALDSITKMYLQIMGGNKYIS